MRNDVLMQTAPANREPLRRKDGTRITVTMPAKQYQQIVQLAKNKKVSASWVVRDAGDRYLEEKNLEGPAALEAKP
jgi:metal-responsive CopG/Arc/MetJ family transcriptional regulator